MEMFPNKKREAFVEYVGRAMDMVKDEWAFQYKRSGALPTQADCDEAELKIKKFCKPLGIAVSADITVFGRKVVFQLADTKGKLYGGDEGVFWNVYETKDDTRFVAHSSELSSTIIAGA